jgi:LysM repeat protein
MDLGKQIGPLPLGAWIAVVGGGLAITYWQRNAGSNDGGGEVPEDTGPDANDVGTGPGWTAVPPPSTAPTDGNTPKFESNEAWGQAAINWLIAQGYSPGISSSAITKALNGGVDINGVKMSIQEWSLWSLALTKFGSPPYPVNVAPPTNVPGPINPSPKPPTPKPPTPKPPSNKVPPYYDVVAKRGDSVSKIAARYHKDWRTVWNFNLRYRPPATAAILRARGPNVIFAGTHIWVPK